MMTPEIAARPTDTQRRDEMMNQAVKGLFVMNGGGSVALLAFLQAIWPQAGAPVGPVLYGLVWMSIGTTLAGSVLLIRYSTTLAFEQDSPWRWWWHYGYLVCAWGSVICFSGGTLTVAVKLLCFLVPRP